MQEIELGLLPIDDVTRNLLKENAVPPAIRGDLAQKESFRKALLWNDQEFMKLLAGLK